jgi:hypothetical protein
VIIKNAIAGEYKIFYEVPTYVEIIVSKYETGKPE